LALAPDGKCVRCRREEEEARAAADDAAAADARRPTDGARLVLVVVALVVLLGGAAFFGLMLWVTHVEAERGKAKAARIAEIEAARAREAAEVDAAAPPLLPLASAKLPPDPPAPAAAAAHGDDRLAAEMHRVPITLYGTPDNGECARARAWLLANGYPFTDRDVASDKAAARQRDAITRARTVPVIDVDGQAITGFDAARVTRALEYAAARRIQR
jgi:glutaredoxin